jgi:hypothetical protein
MHQKSVAIGRRSRDRHRSDIPAGTTPILDNNGLTQCLTQGLRNCARDNVR